MTKERNGTFKWILASIAIGGFFITILTFVIKASWQAAAVSKTLEQNCGEDARVHPIAEQSEKSIIGIEKDVGQIQKDMSSIVEAQKSIDKRLADLFMLQMVGPGSGSPP